MLASYKSGLPGLSIRPTVQELCLFHLSLTLFLPEHVCPNGLSLMSLSVAQFSSSARTNSTSQLEDNWNSSKSLAVGNTPEVLPGTGIPPTHTSSNAGAIAGGVVGGVAAIAAAGLAIFFWLRRKPRPQDPFAAFVVDGAPQPLMGELRPPVSDDRTYMAPPMPGTPGTLGTPMRLYDPSDPTTFPGFQGVGQIHAEVPTAHSGNTLANIQTSPPPAYHSLPIV